MSTKRNQVRKNVRIAVLAVRILRGGSVDPRTEPPGDYDRAIQMIVEGRARKGHAYA